MGPLPKQFFGRLPAALQILVLVLLSVPLGAALFLPSLRHLYLAGPLSWSFVAFAFAYYAGPVVVVLSTLRRSIITLPLFVALCVALILETVFAPGEGSSSAAGSLAVVRYVLVGLMLIVGCALTDRDLIFPFLARTQRFWRRAPRLDANRTFTLQRPDTDESAPLLMQDCSLTGVGLVGERLAVRRLLTGVGQGDNVRLHYKIAGSEYLVVGRLMWMRDLGALCQVGLAVDDPVRMAEIIARLPRGHVVQLSSRLAQLWTLTAFRRTALVLWGATLGGAFMSPACGRQEDGSREGGAGAAAVSDATSGTALPKAGEVPPPPEPGADGLAADPDPASGATLAGAGLDGGEDQELDDGATAGGWDILGLEDPAAPFQLTFGPDSPRGGSAMVDGSSPLPDSMIQVDTEECAVEESVCPGFDFKKPKSFTAEGDFRWIASADIQFYPTFSVALNYDSIDSIALLLNNMPVPPGSQPWFLYASLPSGPGPGLSLNPNIRFGPCPSVANGQATWIMSATLNTVTADGTHWEAQHYTGTAVMDVNKIGSQFPPALAFSMTRDATDKNQNGFQCLGNGAVVTARPQF